MNGSEIETEWERKQYKTKYTSTLREQWMWKAKTRNVKIMDFKKFIRVKPTNAKKVENIEKW